MSARESLFSALRRRFAAWRVSGWFGIASDRWMVGVILNTEACNLGFGFGPVYFGIGAIRG